MTIGTVVRSVMGALGLLAAFAPSGYAADVLFHGSLCNPERGSVSQVEYNQFGVHNTNTAAPAVVNCGGAIALASALNQVSVFVFDRNSATGADVKCTLTVANTVGAALFTDTQSSVGAQSLFQQLDFFPGTTNGTIHLRCEIPPPQGGNFSHVHAYAVTTTP